MIPIIGDAIQGFIKSTLGSVVDKALSYLPESEREKARTEINQANLEQEAEATFRSWVTEYEGSIKDLPRGWVGQVIIFGRCSLRPILTHLCVWTTAYLIWVGLEVPAILAHMDYIVLSFWFGERAAKAILPILGEIKNGK